MYTNNQNGRIKQFNDELRVKFSTGLEFISDRLNFKKSHLFVNGVLAVLVFAVTFVTTNINRSDIHAATSVNQPKAAMYNDKAIEVNYGDQNSVVNVAREILKGKVSSVAEAKEVELADGTKAYSLDDYLIKVNAPKAVDNNEVVYPLSIEKQNSFAGTDNSKLLLGEKNTSKDVTDGNVYLYNVRAKLADKSAPQIDLSANKVIIQETDKFDPSKYINQIKDNKDNSVSNYTVSGDITKNDEGNYNVGNYTITYHATDANGNLATKKLDVEVVEDKIMREQKQAEATQQAQANVQAQQAQPKPSMSIDQPTGNKGAAIAQAALAQLGVNQDCTMLVTNSVFRATGKYFHGWPTEYYALGDVVANPQPGDICIYPGHVAIYIGNGQAVHGGWNGGTTAIASVNCSAGSPTYVRVR